MLVRTIADLEQLGRIRFPADQSFRSARFFTADDSLGFSYNENAVKAGTDLVVWLKHHWEANYIISGAGEVTDLTTGERWLLEAGVLYVVGPNDRHRLHLTEDECHLSIFHPPLKGDERFDEDGAYEASGPVPATDRRMFVKRVDELRRVGFEQVSKDGKLRTLALLDEADDVGFCMSDMRLEAGAEAEFHGARQAIHIVSGEGAVRDVAGGESAEVGPSTAFAAGEGEQRVLRAETSMHVLNVVSYA